MRLAGPAIDWLCERVVSEVRGAAEETEVVTIYRRQGLHTDLAIHLERASATEEEQASGLGLRLASALKAHGLVEHTLWKEE